MRLTEIAKKIDAHLKRFEADKKINKLNERYNTVAYYNANARQTGAKVAVRYISYQGRSLLDKKTALRYLAWLDAGNVGRHTDCRRDTEFVAPTDNAPECAGCGEIFGKRTRTASILCGTGEVDVCASDRGYAYDRYPKKACARKAREKLALCPGCDAPDTEPGTLCSDCLAKMERYDGIDDAGVRGYYLSEKLVGPYLGTYYDEDDNKTNPAEDLLVLLCQLAAPEGLRRWADGGCPDWTSRTVLGADRGDSPHTGMPAVELDDGQKEAMLHIGTFIERLTKAQHLDGLKDGSGVLRRLVSGEMSIRDFNEWQLQSEQRYGASEEE